MNYLIAVMPNRIDVEAAYTALERENLPMSQVTILGHGYQSADEFGLINPDQQAQKWSRRLAYQLIPFGFVAGFIFDAITHLNVLTWSNDLINHVVGGLLGAGAGALGALLTGGGIGWTTASGDAIAYRNRLNDGKYLIITTGPKALIRQATKILRQFKPENIQGYTQPIG